MKKAILTCIVLLSFFNINKAQINLLYEENKTVTYDEAIKSYKYLAQKYDIAELQEKGLTDIGRPLHLFVISDNKEFNPELLRKEGKRIILISNGIHPGEPCGIDGSIKFAETILSQKKYKEFLKNTVVCIIPVYNIGGTLNRSKYWRPQQPGPEECGFRGNARNLDLNRDFVKLDTENARSFKKILHEWKPDIYLDTHTTNGSDQKYSITLISTQKDQLEKNYGEFLKNTFEPELYKKMKVGDYELIPYINWFHGDPENGIVEALINGNFSSGYGRLFNTLSFMTENHVYKSFRDRVLSVYNFELVLLETTSKLANEIGALKKKAIEETINKEEFILSWKVDSTKYDTFTFEGYKRVEKKNAVTGLNWKEYDHDLPFKAEVPFYRYYTPELTITKPEMYIIPQAWREVIDALKLNKVEMKRLSKDQSIDVEVYYIEDNIVSEKQYNGRLRNIEFNVRTEKQTIQYYKGDYIVELNQEANMYIVEMLEPQADASFFHWNFFSPILETREYLTYNGFEDEALEYLKENPGLKEKLEEKKKEDDVFSKDHYAQMWFIFRNSPYYEKTHMRYPIARITDKIEIPMN